MIHWGSQRTACIHPAFLKLYKIILKRNLIYNLITKFCKCRCFSVNRPTVRRQNHSTIGGFSSEIFFSNLYTNLISRNALTQNNNLNTNGFVRILDQWLAPHQLCEKQNQYMCFFAFSFQKWIGSRTNVNEWWEIYILP